MSRWAMSVFWETVLVCNQKEGQERSQGDKKKKHSPGPAKLTRCLSVVLWHQHDGRS
jgi:hypothetical protein